MQTAMSQQHATGMMGLTVVLLLCHQSGQLSAALLWKHLDGPSVVATHVPCLELPAGYWAAGR